MAKLVSVGIKPEGSYNCHPGGVSKVKISFPIIGGTPAKFGSSNPELAAKIAKKHGGFFCGKVKSVMFSQIHLTDLENDIEAIEQINRHRDEILRIATDNIVECSKPHIANHPMHAAAFDDRGYGIVSCYNALPLAGGSSTLTRINLKEVALRSRDETDFFANVLPRYMELNFRLIESRIDFLFEQSNFFTSFLVDEGWIVVHDD